MGKNPLGYYTAYAVLVIGAVMALVFSERPLSATVVTLALFSFNLAALMFVVPQLLGFVERMRGNDNQNDKIMAVLQNISKRMENLQQPSELTHFLNTSPDTTSLKNALNQTATQSNLTIDSLRKTNTSARPVEKTTPAPLATHNSPDEAIFGNKFASRPATSAPVAPVKVAQNQPSQPLPQTAQQDLFAASNASASMQPHIVQPIIEMATPAIVNEPLPAAQAVRLTAYIDIGENDVLCLRGEGGGLNWQEGIPLNEEGDSRWVWMSEPTSTPITCRIYLNDEISAFGDDIVLHPGQNMEVAPSFPQVEA